MQGPYGQLLREVDKEVSSGKTKQRTQLSDFGLRCTCRVPGEAGAVRLCWLRDRAFEEPRSFFKAALVTNMEMQMDAA